MSPSCRQSWTYSLLLPLVVLIVSCGYASAPQAPRAISNRLLDPVPRERYADDVGRFLAGVPGRPGSPFVELENEQAWREHRKALDKAWAKMQDDRLPAMSAFQKAEFSGKTNPAAPVFYPFSGPDVMTVEVFFPQSPVYVMVGLEPAGTLPAPKDFEKKNLEQYLDATRASISSELDRSFFITRQMDRQFRGQVTDGLDLPILELLVRSGNTIQGFRYVRLDDKGEIIERAADYHAPGHIGNKGLEIEFLRDSDQSVHKLFYFSVNLSNSRLQEDPEFLTFLHQLQGATTFLKATSYMIHNPGFSMIRERVLAESGAVLQDDSGVPYHYYLTSNWRVQLYGQYSEPYGSFRYLEQRDLKEAYLAQKPMPLPFRIGYGFRNIPSNLLFATRSR